MRRPEFLEFVAAAIHRANRPEIARVETVLAAVDDPSGLRITAADGDAAARTDYCRPPGHPRCRRVRGG